MFFFKKTQILRETPLRFILALVISGSPSLVAISCVPKGEKALADTAVAKFHRDFNESRFTEMYDAVSDDAKAKLSRDDFVAGMKAMRTGQGAVLDSRDLSTDYNYLNGAEMIKITAVVTFEKGRAKEEFIFHINNGKAQLASYRFLGP